MMGLRLLSECYGKAQIAARRKILRAGRAFATARRLPIPHGFFDEYPQFYSGSETGASPNRLNQRYRACIEWNEAVIKGHRVLDLASHDGRWSFAAMKAGATSVVGIEARDYLVETAALNLSKYGIPEDSFRFVAGDAYEQLEQIEPNSVDTVLCFGFFYHVANHMLLLSKIAKLKPKYLVLDTALYLDPYPVICIGAENSEGEANAARIGSDRIGSDAKLVVSGAPSKSALELMLSNFGWSFVYFDWHRAGIRRWDDIVDYQEGWRVTLRVNCSQ